MEWAAEDVADIGSGRECAAAASLRRVPDRLAHVRRIAALDPRRDYHAIYRITAQYEFPWDVTRALELALYRTYCVPSVAALLDRTGEFRTRTQRRYDDTALLLGEVLEHGFDAPRGRAAIRRINRIHARFAISQDDYRYVLATFVFVPERWLDRFGWRPLLGVEREAAFHYYRALGVRMGIRDLPATREAFATFFDDYERRHFAYGDAQRRVGTATRELFVSWLPAALGPAARLGVHALLDPPVRQAFGFPDPPRWLPAALHATLRARARAERFLPPRRRPVLTRDSRLVRSYPDGYDVAALGPPPAD